MLIVLSMQKRKNRTFLFPRRNNIVTEKLTDGRLSVLNVKYSTSGKRISMKKLCRICDGISDTVLCPEGIIPENAPLMRFCDNTLQLILMERFLFSLLSDFPSENVRICLCDPFARFYELAERLSEHCPGITVATRMYHFYNKRADSLSGKGRLIITESPSCLPECDIIIHPEPVSTALPECRIILSAYEPLIDDKRIIYRYNADIPDRYKALIPAGTDEQYFLCALYSLERRKELAEIVPSTVQTKQGALSREYILNILSEG